MTDDRLLRDDGDPLAQELLRAGAEERPSDEARARTLAALGITGVGAGAAAGAAGIAATPRGRAGLGRLVRWIGLAVTIAVAVGFGWRALRPDAPSVSVPSAESVATAPAATPADQAVVASPSVGETVALSVPVVAPASAPKRMPALSAAPAASQDTGLAAEVAALDRARGALASGDAPRALLALDDYKRSFPHGVLGQEAAVVRIEALVRSGNPSAARALADRFLAANPSSPHAPRVRHLVGEQDPP